MGFGRKVRMKSLFEATIVGGAGEKLIGDGSVEGVAETDAVFCKEAARITRAAMEALNDVGIFEKSTKGLRSVRVEE